MSAVDPPEYLVVAARILTLKCAECGEDIDECRECGEYHEVCYGCIGFRRELIECWDLPFDYEEWANAEIDWYYDD